MSSIAAEALARCDAISAELDKLDAFDVEGLSSTDCRALLQRRQTLRQRLAFGDHELVNELAMHASVADLGDRPAHVLADDLRISRGEARRRIEEAADLAPRRALTGEPLPARLEATAAGQKAGLIGAEHIKIIRGFLAQLPCFVDEAARVKAERDLAEAATQFRPDEVKQLADHIDLCLNPDGNFTDEHRARRRGITVGRQGRDGMSRISGYLTPEARAGWDAMAAKWAAPGMCNPVDEEPTITGTPSDDAIAGDDRTAAQRNHDAFNAMVRSALTSGELGEHNGLPVTIVATAALEDLQAKTGRATTGGGSWLPVTDLIRMGGQAYNFLLLFDKANRCELYKGRSTRLATPAQRLVLYALERGCTRPGCDVPAYWCQVHHTKGWANGGKSNVDEETLACGPDNRFVDDGGWTTRKHQDGTTEWIPPPHLDRGQRRRNTYWRPEKMLPDDDEPE